MNNKKASGSKSLFFESVIIVAIAAGLVFLNLYTENLFTKLHAAGHSAVFVKDDVVFDNDREFTEQLIEYLPSTYKMIELYDDNLELLFQIQFNEDFIPTENIQSYPQLSKILMNNPNGQANILIDGVEQNVYFEWLNNTHGEHRLLIVYSSIETVQGIWVFHLVSYLIIVLAFSLIIVMKLKHHNEKIKSYRDLIQSESGGSL